MRLALIVSLLAFACTGDPASNTPVEAGFWIDTGGDQGRRARFGLGVTGQIGDRTVTRNLATCDYAGHGDPLAPADAIEQAQCDDHYYDLIVTADEVIVRDDQGVKTVIIAR